MYIRNYKIVFIWKKRLLDVVLSFGFVMVTPYLKNSITNEYDYKFYLACFFVWLYGTIVTSSVFVSQISFFARISDERIGGVYQFNLGIDIFF